VGAGAVAGDGMACARDTTAARHFRQERLLPFLKIGGIRNRIKKKKMAGLKGAIGLNIEKKRGGRGRQGINEKERREGEAGCKS